MKKYPGPVSKIIFDKSVVSFCCKNFRSRQHSYGYVSSIFSLFAKKIHTDFLKLFLRRVLAVFLLTLGLFGVGAPVVQAQSIADRYDDIQDQGLIFAGICPGSNETCDCRDYGKCTLEDMMQLLVNLSVFIFGITGSVMMLIIVYGGFKWIMAHGESAMVEEGRKALIGGLVGLAIIMGAYAAINVIVSVIKTGEIPTTDIEETIGEGAEDIIDTQ